MSIQNLVIPTEVYSRVAGYYRPIMCWNEGKRQEFKDRRMFDRSIKEAKDGKTE